MSRSMTNFGKFTADVNKVELEHRDVLPKQKHFVHPAGSSGCKLNVPSLQTSHANPCTFGLQKQVALV